MSTAPFIAPSSIPSAGKETAPAPNHGASFLDLSAELRNIVYDLYFEPNAMVELKAEPQYSTEPALLFACRRVRDEAMTMFNSRTAYHTNNMGTALGYLARRTRKQLSGLKKLEITCPSDEVGTRTLRQVKRFLHRVHHNFTRKGLKEHALVMQMPVFENNNNPNALTWVSYEDIGDYILIHGAQNHVTRRKTPLKKAADDTNKSKVAKQAQAARRAAKLQKRQAKRKEAETSTGCCDESDWYEGIRDDP